MNFRFPPSSAFNFITTWAVVAEPEKKYDLLDLPAIGVGAANLAMQYGHPSRCPNSLGSTVSFLPHFGQQTIIPLPSCHPYCLHVANIIAHFPKSVKRGAVFAIRYGGVPFAFVAIAHHE